MFDKSDWIMFHYRDWLNMAQDGRTKKWGMGQSYFPHPENHLRLLTVDRQSKMITLDQLFDVQICNQQQKKDIIFSL